MQPFAFPADASWIWCADTARRLNRHVRFRRAFTVEGRAESACLDLTADSRYELFVNGVWVGFGPARGYPERWAVDRYDLRPWLRPGVNVLAVSVHEFGIGTFQYLDAAPGLVARLAWRDKSGDRTLATDAAWRAAEEPGYRREALRISCQQGWEEQFDARRALGDWAAPAFDDKAWAPAAVVAPVGGGDHPVFETRGIPFLTRQPLDAVACREAVAVHSPTLAASVDLREAMGLADRSANHMGGHYLAGLRIKSPVRQSARLWSHGFGGAAAMRLNGRELAMPDPHAVGPRLEGAAEIELREGWNHLLIRPAEVRHTSQISLAFWAGHALELDDADGRGPWFFFGPFPLAYDTPEAWAAFRTRQPLPLMLPETYPPGATYARFEELWTRDWPTDAERESSLCRRLPSVPSPGLLGLCDRPLDPDRDAPGGFPEEADTGPRDARGAFLFDHGDATTVAPPPLGADGVRLLLDFGRETVGFVEFDLDAPAGTVVDAAFFEFIQPDGRRNLTEGMNNSLRYIAREGSQRFRSWQRRGGRYLYLTLRDFARPVTIRRAGLVESLYPQDRRGTFACSDARLEQVWEAAARSVACCSEDAYTDCPTYEQTLWVGDARNESMVDLIANGDARLSRRCWFMAARSLERGDFTNSQVPSAWDAVIPAWTFLWMRWGEEHWRATGDDVFGREALVWLALQAENLERRVDERGLFFFAGWNMFDWAPMDTPSSGVVTHQHCLAVLALRQCAGMAEELDEAERAAGWRKLADRIADGVNRHLWNDEARAYIDCIRADGSRSPVLSQQTHTAAHLAGVPTPERAARVRAIVEQPPEGFVTAGSPFFMFFFLELLANEGRHDELLDVIRSYWGGQIEAGATTFWEMYHPGQPRLTRSHCHGWSAAPAYFLTRDVLGVWPAAPGYAALRIAPRGGLAYCRGTVPTPRGDVGCSWTRGDDGALTLELNLPAPTPVTVDWGFAATVEALDGGGAEPREEDEGRHTTVPATGARLRLRAIPKA